jgi:biopolymer transport protein ExbD
MLVLLIIFMITAPLMAHKLPASIPIPAKEQTTNPQEPVIVKVAIRDVGGATQVLLDGTPIDLNSLLVTLRTQAQRDPKPDVMMITDGTVPYQAMAEVLSGIKRAGIERVRVFRFEARARWDPLSVRRSAART